jgi:DNA-binding MarR family transcriptional regulator
MLDAMRRLIVAAERFRTLAARHVGLGLGEVLVLSRIGRPAPATPSELADELGRNPSTITATLDRLEATGMITRSAHPRDGRKSAVYVTKEGQQVLQWIRSFSDDAFQDLASSDLAELAENFSQVAAAIEAQAARIPD